MDAGLRHSAGLWDRGVLFARPRLGHQLACKPTAAASHCCLTGMNWSPFNSKPKVRAMPFRDEARFRLLPQARADGSQATSPIRAVGVAVRPAWRAWPAAYSDTRTAMPGVVGSVDHLPPLSGLTRIGKWLAAQTDCSCSNCGFVPSGPQEGRNERPGLWLGPGLLQQRHSQTGRAMERVRTCGRRVAATAAEPDRQQS